MPTYTFKREECCGDQMQLWTDFMTIAEKEVSGNQAHGNPTILFGVTGNPSLAEGLKMRRIDMWDDLYGPGSQNVGLGWFNFQITYQV